jgi:hypothetical protein
MVCFLFKFTTTIASTHNPLFRSKPRLRDAEEVEIFLEKMDFFHRIIQGFSAFVNHPILSFEQYFRNAFIAKLIGTVRILGSSTLANGLVELNVVLNSSKDENDLKLIMSKFILESSSRNEDATRSARCLLREVGNVLSNANIQIIEDYWTEVICNHVTEQIVHAFVQLKNHSLDSDFSYGIVQDFIRLLYRIRDISRIDMAVTKACYIAADTAFELAFRRLPKDISILLTKIIVVQLSSLIDSIKVTDIPSEAPQISLDSIIDLIQVHVCL